MRPIEAEEFKGFYIEKTDLIDYAQTEEEAKQIVAKLSAQNQDDCVYKYSSAIPNEPKHSLKDKNLNLYTKLVECVERENGISLHSGEIKDIIGLDNHDSAPISKKFIVLIDELLQRPDILIDAVQNPDTNWDAESLMNFAVNCNKFKENLNTK